MIKYAKLLGVPPLTVDCLEEVLTVRNAVAHSHVWEGEIYPITITWVEGPVLHSDEFGDKRHTLVTGGAVRTNKFDLNVILGKVGRSDVAKALSVVDNLWHCLGSKHDLIRFRTIRAHVPFRFKSKLLHFRTVCRELLTDWAPGWETPDDL